MKKKIFTLLALFAGVLGAYADNTITVSEGQVPVGQTGSFDIELNNTDEFKGFTMTLTLPSGVTLVSVTNNSERMGELVDPTGSNPYGLGYISMSAIKGNSGTIFTVNVKADAGLSAGKLDAKLDKITFGKSDGSGDVVIADVNFQIEIIDRVTLDENSTVVPSNYTNANVLVKRTIKTNQWSTICLPFAMSAEQMEAAFGAGVQLANFTGYTYDDTEETITVNFETVTSIAANHPYLIKVKTAEDITSFTVDGVDVNPSDELTIATVERKKKQYSEMTGTYVANTVLEENTLFLSGNKFYYSTGTTVMKAFRAFFDFYDEVDHKVSAPNINIDVDGQTTRIENLNVLFDDGQYFNLKGQKVDNPTEKGVYIKNGKKVVIK